MKMKIHMKNQLVAKAKIRRPPRVFQQMEKSDIKDAGC